MLENQSKAETAWTIA